MEDMNKKDFRNKLVIAAGTLFVVLCVWQIVVLKLLEKGIISTLIAMILIEAGILVAAGLIGAIIKFAYDIFQQVISDVGQTSKGGVVEEKIRRMSERDDEIGAMFRSVHNTVTSLAKLVLNISQTSDRLTEISNNFRTIFSNMTAAVEQTGEEVGTITTNTVSQAGQTNDMKEKIDAISVSIENIIQNVELLTESADLMKKYNGSVEEIMKELIHISEKSSQAIENVRKQTDLTNQSAQQIRAATEIIAGISSQTNLLALNASIEAARAGEHGKGFAVVAEEIRALADQSKESTEQIGKVVKNLLDNSDVSVEITKEVSEAFLKQNKKIQDTEVIFNSLNQEIGKVNSSIHVIVSEVEGLDTHRQGIGNGIVSLTDCAQQNADSAQITTENMEEFRQIVNECNEATENVVKISEELVGYIKEFSMDSMKQKVLG